MIPRPRTLLLKVANAQDFMALSLTRDLEIEPKVDGPYERPQESSRVHFEVCGG